MEALALLIRIVELCVGIADLHFGNKEFKTLGDTRLSYKIRKYIGGEARKGTFERWWRARGEVRMGWSIRNVGCMPAGSTKFDTEKYWRKQKAKTKLERAYQGHRGDRQSSLIVHSQSRESCIAPSKCRATVALGRRL